MQLVSVGFWATTPSRTLTCVPRLQRRGRWPRTLPLNVYPKSDGVLWSTLEPVKYDSSIGFRTAPHRMAPADLSISSAGGAKGQYYGTFHVLLQRTGQVGPYVATGLGLNPIRFTKMWHLQSSNEQLNRTCCSLKPRAALAPFFAFHRF